MRTSETLRHDLHPGSARVCASRDSRRTTRRAGLAHASVRTAFVITLATFVGIARPASASAQLVMGSGPGASALIRVIDPATGSDRSFVPYPGFIGGIRVALGDVNGDGVLDIVTAPGPGGGPHVQVFDGT